MTRRTLVLTAALALLTGQLWARGGGGGGGRGGGGLGGGGFRAGGFGGGSHGEGGGWGYWLSLAGTVAAAVFVYYVSEWIGRARAARAARLAPPAPTLVSLVAVLDRGAFYVPALRGLAARSEFGTPRGRAHARKAIAALVRPEDVRDGFSRPLPGPDTDGARARELWERQMRLVEITPETLNVSSPDERTRLSEPASRREGTGVCLVGVVATAVPREGGADAARAALGALGKTPGGAFYFYYAPGTGESLDLSEARALLNVLRLNSLRLNSPR